LWGNTWTYSDINASDFGVALATSNAGLISKSVYIDHIRITVYYTSPGNADWIMSVSSTNGALTIMPSFTSSNAMLGIGTTAPAATLDVNGTIKGQLYEHYTGTISRTSSNGNGTTSLNTGKYFPEWFCALSRVDIIDLDTENEHAYCNVTLSSNQWVLEATIQGASDQAVNCGIICFRL